MNITLKPLTARVMLTDNDSASIIIADERGSIAIGPLTHYHFSERGAGVINDHIAQLVNMGTNIVNLETSIPGIKLP